MYGLHLFRYNIEPQRNHVNNWGDIAKRDIVHSGWTVEFGFDIGTTLLCCITVAMELRRG